MKILLVDTYYPDFLATLEIDPDCSYELQLRKVLYQSFGTADFYSRNLAAYGWEAIDVIANEERLQRMWAREHDAHGDTLMAQIRAFAPDVVFMQDLNYGTPDMLAQIKDCVVLAGQCSSKLPPEANVRQFDVIFTSIPSHVGSFEAQGVRAIYNPLAFDPIVVMGRTTPPSYREIDVSFLGGVGPSWGYGTRVLEAVAQAIPTAAFWGYGFDQLPSNSPIRQRYRGPAWGLRYYEILEHSKIVLNRHGEVSQGWANNMRMFEATGCGALLLTDDKLNLGELFFPSYEILTYASPDEAVQQIVSALGYWETAKQIAMHGQERTMREHTYAKRMQLVSDVLSEEVQSCL